MYLIIIYNNEMKFVNEHTQVFLTDLFANDFIYIKFLQSMFIFSKFIVSVNQPVETN